MKVRLNQTESWSDAPVYLWLYSVWHGVGCYLLWPQKSNIVGCWDTNFMLSYKIYIPWHSINLRLKKGQKKPKTTTTQKNKTKKQTQINKTQIHVTMNMMSLLCFSKKKNELNMSNVYRPYKNTKLSMSEHNQWRGCTTTCWIHWHL